LPAAHLHAYNVSYNSNISGQQPEEVRRSNISVLKSSISLWTERGFLSSKAKDIGTLQKIDNYSSTSFGYNMHLIYVYRV
jgi:hypothetical protein